MCRSLARVTGSRRLEFWPDYGGALLHEAGERVPLDSLPLRPEVIDRAARWVATYDDARLDPTDPDPAWRAEGRALYEVLREELAGHGIVLFDWEGIWGTGGGPETSG
jgi:hypothetical protein